MVHVLVIGGAGYIGSHVVLELIGKGHKVSVFDNLSSGWKENIPCGVEFIESDILDDREVEEACSKNVDAVVHLAALKAAGESMSQPEKYSKQNICGTINILNAMCKNGVKYLIFSSSAAVYGKPEYLPVDEEHPKNPINYYGFTKLEIERILKWYSELKGLRFVALRYFNAAGHDILGRIKKVERNPSNLLPVIMEVANGTREKLQIFGDDYDTHDGTGVRDYIHVNDLASGHILALDYLLSGKESVIVNLGSDNGLSIKELVRKAEEVTSRKINFEVVGRREGDPAKLVASSDKARKILGWQAKYSDAETLVRSMWGIYRDLRS